MSDKLQADAGLTEVYPLSPEQIADYRRDGHLLLRQWRTRRSSVLTVRKSWKK